MTALCSVSCAIYKQPPVLLGPLCLVKSSRKAMNGPVNCKTQTEIESPTPRNSPQQARQSRRIVRRIVQVPVLFIIVLSGGAGTASMLPICLEAIQDSGGQGTRGWQAYARPDGLGLGNGAAMRERQPTCTSAPLIVVNSSRVGSRFGSEFS